MNFCGEANSTSRRLLEKVNIVRIGGEIKMERIIARFI